MSGLAVLLPHRHGRPAGARPDQPGDDQGDRAGASPRCSRRRWSSRPPWRAPASSARPPRTSTTCPPTTSTWSAPRRWRWPPTTPRRSWTPRALPRHYVGLQPVLPARGRLVRQGHPRHLPGALVRQGRDVRLLRARARPRPSTQKLLGFEKEFIDALELPFQVLDVAAGDLGPERGPQVRLLRLAAHPGALPRDHLHVELHRVPGAPAEHPDPRRPTASRSAATLNGTLCAMTRMIIMLLENHQQADGSVRAAARPASLPGWSGSPASRRADERAEHRWRPRARWRSTSTATIVDHAGVLPGRAFARRSPGGGRRRRAGRPDDRSQLARHPSGLRAARAAARPGGLLQRGRGGALPAARIVQQVTTFDPRDVIDEGAARASVGGAGRGGDRPGLPGHPALPRRAICTVRSRSSRSTSWPAADVTRIVVRDPDASDGEFVALAERLGLHGRQLLRRLQRLARHRPGGGQQGAPAWPRWSRRPRDLAPSTCWPSATAATTSRCCSGPDAGWRWATPARGGGERGRTSPGSFADGGHGRRNCAAGSTEEPGDGLACGRVGAMLADEGHHAASVRARTRVPHHDGRRHYQAAQPLHAAPRCGRSPAAATVRSASRRPNPGPLDPAQHGRHCAVLRAALPGHAAGEVAGDPARRRRLGDAVPDAGRGAVRRPSPSSAAIPNLFEILSYDYWHANYGYELPARVAATASRPTSARRRAGRTCSRSVAEKLRAGGRTGRRDRRARRGGASSRPRPGSSVAATT